MTKRATVKTLKNWEAEFKTNFLHDLFGGKYVAYNVIHTHGGRKEDQVVKTFHHSGLNLAVKVFPKVV